MKQDKIKDIEDLLLKIKPINIYNKGRKIINDNHYKEVQKKNKKELLKQPARTDILNYLLALKPKETVYLEIGVRDPEHNYNHIKSETKYSVDPGIEFKDNPVDFQMTSDEFFRQLTANLILTKNTRFDIIFIDGLHLAHQVDKDIENALNYIKDDGFIVLHDCNPPTEWHARETRYYHTPANAHWNGSTWKAFMKWRSNPTINSCCIDTDWGVGIISKTHLIGEHIKNTNPFFEFKKFETNRKEYLNLMDFESFKQLINK